MNVEEFHLLKPLPLNTRLPTCGARSTPICHYPSLVQDLEATGIGSLYNLQLPSSGAPDHERHLFTGIAAISKDTLRCQRVDDCHRGARFTPFLLAHRNVERMMHALQGAIPVPQFQIVMHSVARAAEAIAT